MLIIMRALSVIHTSDCPKQKTQICADLLLKGNNIAKVFS